MSAQAALPEGRAGQGLALLITLLALVLLWLGIIAPLGDWYFARADLLAEQQQEIARGEALRQSLPALRAAAKAAAAQADANGILLPGATDDIAGANLQQDLQNLAAQAGTSLDSITTVAAQPEGTLRRIGVQVSVTATWPVLIALLAAIDSTRPRMVVDQLTLTNPGSASPGEDPQLQAGFTVAAFRTGAP